MKAMEDEDYFEKMYEEEMEFMREQEAMNSVWAEEIVNDYEKNKGKQPQSKSRRALDFSKCVESHSSSEIQKVVANGIDCIPSTSKKRLPDDEMSSTPNKKARMEAELVPLSSAKRRIPKNNFISVTGFDGSIYYVDVIDRTHKASEFIKRTSQLLATPLSIMKEEIFEEILLLKNANGTQRNELNLRPNHGDDNDDQPKKLLWVDKYSPKSYFDLISEEATNRNLLAWLKLWDHSTFGIELKPKGIDQKEKHDRKFQKSFGNNPVGQNNDHPLGDFDKNKRPRQKVALISGPPGYGKTTLAHVIGNHAGYNVVEMNASDDRAVEVFKEKIETATQMKAVMGGINPRPNCLVIDEIDGAPQPAIDILINMIKKSDPSSNSAPKSSNKKKKDLPLVLRPIICICNDLYVPALRLLRQMCYQVHFHPPRVSSLTGRLLEISRLESIKADNSALTALCEKTENDIRSCINTLQFVKTKYLGELKAELVASLGLGQKDFQRNLFSMWTSIFTLPKPIKSSYIDPNDREKIPRYWRAGKKVVTLAERTKTILHLAYSSDGSKLHQGLFENYLTTSIKDPGMKKISEAIDSLCDSDLLETKISSLQDYSMMKYQSFIPVMFHLLFAVNRPNKINFPKKNFEFQTSLSCSREILLTFLHSIPPSSRSCLSSSALVMEMIPYLSLIIQPSLRPVNVHLYTAHEKKSLNQVVRMMMIHNLSYRQEKNDEGQYSYSLDPDIEKLTKFSDSKVQKLMSYSCKQLISREIELERMRHSEGSIQADKSKNNLKTNNETIKPKIIKEVKGPVDFFGRRIEKQATEGNQDKDANKNSSLTIFGYVWYKYKEGFSNAVKRTCKVKDFM